MNSYPVIEVFSGRQLNCGTKIDAWIKASLRLFMEAVPYSAVNELFFRSERLKLENT